jgi:hypothetical protein
VRSALAWDGFRSRWSRLDSAGVSLRDIGASILPTAAVGLDHADGHQLKLFSGETGASGALSFPWVGLYAHGGDAWVEAVEAENVTNPGRFTLKLERVENLGAFNTVAPTVGCSEPPVAVSLIVNAAVQAVPIVGAIMPLVRLEPERPGFLVPDGSVLVVATRVASQTGLGFFLVREIL